MCVQYNMVDVGKFRECIMESSCCATQQNVLNFCVCTSEGVLAFGWWLVVFTLRLLVR